MSLHPSMLSACLSPSLPSVSSSSSTIVHSQFPCSPSHDLGKSAQRQLHVYLRDSLALSTHLALSWLATITSTGGCAKFQCTCPLPRHRIIVITTSRCLSAKSRSANPVCTQLTLSEQKWADKSLATVPPPDAVLMHMSQSNCPHVLEATTRGINNSGNI